MQADNVIARLRHPVIVVKAKLDNRKPNPYLGEDWAGGNIAIGGHASNTTALDNSELAISNAQPLHAAVTQVIKNSYRRSVSIGSPFEDSSAAVSFSFIQLDDSGEQLYSLADWDDREVAVYVGGVLDEGTADEYEMPFDEYLLMLDGKFNGYDSLDSNVDVAIGMRSGELQTNFPPNRYEDGTVKPYIVGAVIGATPYDIDGQVRQFHDAIDGPVGISDFTYTFPPFVYIGGEFNFARSGVETTTVNSIGPTSTTVESSGFNWFDDSGGVRVIGDLPMRADVIGDATINATQNGTTFELSRDNGAGIQTYDGNKFSWEELTTGTLTARGGPAIEVEIADNINIEVLAGRWFSLSAENRGDGGGAITFRLGGALRFKDCVIMVRGARGPGQVILNQSHTPDSVSPPFVNSVEVFNHAMTYTSVNEQELSFTYSASNPAARIAIRIVSLTVYDVVSAAVKLSLETPALSLNLITTLVADGSRVIKSIDPAITAALPLENSNSDVSAVLDFNGGGEGTTFDEVTINVELGHGRTVFEVSQAVLPLGDVTYGVRTVGNTFIMAPEPVLFSEAPAVFVNIPFLDERAALFGSLSRVQTSITAQVTGGDLDSVRVLVRYGNDVQFIDVTRTLQTFTVDHLTIQGDGIQLEAYRGAAGNTDTDYEVTVSKVEATAGLFEEPSISVSNVINGVSTQLLSYRVADSLSFPRMPEGLAIYDSNGFMAASDTYAIIGNFIGADLNQLAVGAFRRMSLISAGADLIDADFEGDLVGRMFTEQLPFIEHIENMARELDYFTQENEPTDGLHVARRYDYLSHPSDFKFVETDVINISENRIETSFREYQYIVQYSEDLSDSANTKAYTGDTGWSLPAAARTIRTPLRLLSDAQRIGKLIYRDSVKNSRYDITLSSIGHGLRPTMAGLISHPKIPANKPCIIESITEDLLTLETTLTIKILTGRGTYVG